MLIASRAVGVHINNIEQQLRVLQPSLYFLLTVLPISEKCSIFLKFCAVVRFLLIVLETKIV